MITEHKEGKNNTEKSTTHCKYKLENENLKVGQKVAGKVKNIKPYGAFVDIGNGKVGLVHIKDLSVARIKTPYRKAKIGQNIDVVVKYIDREQGRILLSYKEMLGTWEEKCRKIHTRNQVKGKIRETEKIKTEYL